MRQLESNYKVLLTKERAKLKISNSRNKHNRSENEKILNNELLNDIISLDAVYENQCEWLNQFKSKDAIIEVNNNFINEN